MLALRSAAPAGTRGGGDRDSSGFACSGRRDGTAGAPATAWEQKGEGALSVVRVQARGCGFDVFNVWDVDA